MNLNTAIKLVTEKTEARVNRKRSWMKRQKGTSCRFIMYKKLLHVSIAVSKCEFLGKMKQCSHSNRFPQHSAAAFVRT